MHDQIEQVRAKLKERSCSKCVIEFKKRGDMIHHLFDVHPEEIEPFINQRGGRLMKRGRKTMQVELKDSIFNGAFQLFEVNFNVDTVHSIEGLYNSIAEDLKSKLLQAVQKMKYFKLQFKTKCQFVRKGEDGAEERAQQHFNSTMYRVTSELVIDFAIEDSLKSFMENIEAYEKRGSNWKFEKLLMFEIHLTKYNPLSGGTSFELTDVLLFHPGSFINNRSTDEFCFKRCIYSHEKFCKIPDWVSEKKKYLEGFRIFDDLIDDGQVDWTGLEFPMSETQFSTFEKNNPEIGLCVYYYDPELYPVDLSMAKNEYEKYMMAGTHMRECCTPLYLPTEERNIMVDLLMVQDDNDPEKRHFIRITKPHRLFNLYKRQKMGTKWCRYCLHITTMEDHVKFCAALGRQRTTMGEEPVKFRSYNKTQRMPYTFFADHESSLIKLTKDARNGNLPTDTVNRIIKSEHRVTSYAWICLDWNGNVVYSDAYTAKEENENVMERFLTTIFAAMRELRVKICEFNQAANEMAKCMLPDDALKDIQDQEITCCICEDILWDEDATDKKNRGNIVRHHEHLPPYKYIGLAHRGCNANCRLTLNFSLFYHNMKNYDGHQVILGCTGKLVDQVKIIGQSGEKFMLLQLEMYDYIHKDYLDDFPTSDKRIDKPNVTGVKIKGTSLADYKEVSMRLNILDSYTFFNQAISKIAESLDKNRDFGPLRDIFEEKYGDKVDLLLQKGVYPYGHMDSVARYSETKLPPIWAFYDDLKEKHIKPREYFHAKNVWRKLKIKTMREYCEVYCLTDVAILASAFQKLRETFYAAFNLDPAHYFSLPMLAWDCCLKKTRTEFELITDPDMHVWLESSKRGGYCSAGDLRVARAHNEFVPNFDKNSKDPTSWIIGWDANNLYAGALSRRLPVRGFKWVKGLELEKFKRLGADAIKKIKQKGNTGYFFEVDMEFPPDLHDKFAKFPPAPYKRKVHYEELSYIQQENALDMGMKPGELTGEKLIADLHPRKNYVVHYVALQKYIEIGVKVTNVHRAVKFEQYECFKSYVEFTTQKRREATSAAEKEFWKLANNSIFGKTVENVRKRQRFEIVRTEKEFLKYSAKPTVQSVSILKTYDGSDMALFALSKLSVTLNKPISVGCAVLDLSKSTMYNFYYNFIYPNYEHHNLILTDTDSLYCFIECKNIYDDMKAVGRLWFDMSAYPPDDKDFGIYHDKFNEKVVEKFKDEYSGSVIYEMCIVRPKCYGIKFITKGVEHITGEQTTKISEKKKGKGVPKQALEQQIVFDSYVEAIERNKVTFVSSNDIRSYKHQLCTQYSKKKAISNNDNKRFSVDNIRSLPFGHKDIPLYDEYARVEPMHVACKFVEGVSDTEY